MKQWITEEQFNELSNDKKVIWLDWVREKGYTFAKIYPYIKTDGWMTLGFPSIGEMIEFLNEKQDYQFHIFRRTLDWKVIVNDMQYGKELGGELCDHLWEAVKEILEQ